MKKHLSFIMAAAALIALFSLWDVWNSSSPSGLTICELLNDKRYKDAVRGIEVAREEVYDGPIAEVDFDSYPPAREFRTRISEAVKAGVNFAGHYVVAEWGCGTGCQQHAVVDAVNGKIIAFGLPSELGVSHRKTSTMLIVHPKESFPSPADAAASKEELALLYARVPREYYELVEQDGQAFLAKVCVENATEGVY